MTDFRYGPVELHLVGLPDETPDGATMGALTDLVKSGLVRVLDFVVISKDEDGDVTVVEVEDEAAAPWVDLFELDALGITGSDDIDEFATLIPAGSSAVLVALELSYQRALASSLAASGATLLASERIPAPVVNAIADLIDPDTAEGE